MHAKPLHTKHQLQTVNSIQNGSKLVSIRIKTNQCYKLPFKAVVYALYIRLLPIKGCQRVSSLKQHERQTKSENSNPPGEATF
jgi:hypothetical protein